MRLVSTQLGKVAYVVSSDEAGPKDGVYGPEFERLIAERYAFPNQPERPEGGSLRFDGGRMVAGTRKVNVPALILYSDAVVIETLHTDQSQLVLQDLMTWMGQAFGFREPRTKPLLLFESNVVVDFENPTHKIISTFEETSRSLSAAMKATYDRDLRFDFSGVSIASDPTALPATIASYFKTDFTINRRLNRPFAENRFFCVAPLPTDVHLSLLDDFDKALAG